MLAECDALRAEVEELKRRLLTAAKVADALEDTMGENAKLRAALEAAHEPGLTDSPKYHYWFTTTRAEALRRE